jgi:hypothetical protein
MDQCARFLRMAAAFQAIIPGMPLLLIMRRTALYIWVGPGSIIGLSAALIAICRGGRCRIVDGVLEVHGGGVTRMLSRFSAVPGGISAITLGHVVVGATEQELERTRTHERVHVRQYERWGPLFIPAYLAASTWIWLRRTGHPYRDNPFEVEAYASE